MRSDCTALSPLNICTHPTIEAVSFVILFGCLNSYLVLNHTFSASQTSECSLGMWDFTTLYDRPPPIHKGQLSSALGDKHDH